MFCAAIWFMTMARRRGTQVVSTVEFRFRSTPDISSFISRKRRSTFSSVNAPPLK